MREPMQLKQWLVLRRTYFYDLDHGRHLLASEIIGGVAGPQDREVIEAVLYTLYPHSDMTELVLSECNSDLQWEDIQKKNKRRADLLKDLNEQWKQPAYVGDSQCRGK